MVGCVEYLGEIWYVVNGIWFKRYKDAVRYYNDYIAKNGKERIPLI